MDEAARAYFQAVEQRFVERRGQALLLSPGDVARVAEWHRQGVPLEAVLEGIETHFERLARRGRAPRRAVTLAYLEDEVMDAWAGVRRRKLGRAPVTAGEDGRPSQALATREEHERLVGALRSALDALPPSSDPVPALQAALQGALDKLLAKADLFDERSAEHDDERAEDHLRRIERALLDRVRAAVGEPVVAALGHEAETTLGERLARMTDAARERGVRQLVDRSLRQQLGIPRLSLFYA